jgi:hypothetical protein
MRPTVCLAAKGLVRDARTNNVSVYSILEQVTPAGFPAFIPEVEALAVWQKEAGDDGPIPLTFRVMNNQHQLESLGLTVAFGAAPRHRSMVGLTGLIIREPGELRFEFLRDDQVIASYTVAIDAPANAPQLNN